MLRRRPTALPWYIRLRASNLVMLIVAAGLYLALFLNPKLYTSQVKAGGPLAGVLAAIFVSALGNAFELRNAIRKDASRFRNRSFLACSITLDLVAALAFVMASFVTGALFAHGRPVPTILTIILSLLALIHLITMSFLCREEHLRRTQIARPKDVELLESIDVGHGRAT